LCIDPCKLCCTALQGRRSFSFICLLTILVFYFKYWLEYTWTLLLMMPRKTYPYASSNNNKPWLWRLLHIIYSQSKTHARIEMISSCFNISTISNPTLFSNSIDAKAKMIRNRDKRNPINGCQLFYQYGPDVQTESRRNILGWLTS
jgi:hypothetical protein